MRMTEDDGSPYICVSDAKLLARQCKVTVDALGTAQDDDYARQFVNYRSMNDDGKYIEAW